MTRQIPYEEAIKGIKVTTISRDEFGKIYGYGYVVNGILYRVNNTSTAIAAHYNDILPLEKVLNDGGKSYREWFEDIRKKQNNNYSERYG